MPEDIISRINFVNAKVEKLEEDEKKDGKKSPKYSIECDKLFPHENKSDSNKDNGSPCLWIDFGSERQVSRSSSGDIIGNVIAEDVIVCMLYGPWGPLLQERIVNGEVLDIIRIYKLGTKQGDQSIDQQLTYENCLIKTYRQSGDHLTFSFSYTALEDLKTKYDSKGMKVGQIGTRFDFAKLQDENKK